MSTTWLRGIKSTLLQFGEIRGAPECNNTEGGFFSSLLFWKRGVGEAFSFLDFHHIRNTCLSCRAKAPKYEQTWKVMSQKTTPNLPWLDRSGSDTATEDLRNSDRDAQCHHGRISYGKIDVLNLERKVGQLKVTDVSASAKRGNFKKARWDHKEEKVATLHPSLRTSPLCTVFKTPRNLSLSSGSHF